jgi:cytochrome c oxidase subunit 3
MAVKDNRDYLIHPHYIILFLILAGITALFLGFTFSYLYNRVEQGITPVALPNLFYYNSILLLLSSGGLWHAKKAYLADNTAKYKLALTLTLILTICFLIAQIFAWMQLNMDDIAVSHSTMASYLYLISGLHFLHVAVGIPFLAYFLLIAQKKMKSPVSVLIYFSDINKRRKLDLLNIYWHFLDALWIYLVVFFLINYLIK